MENKNQTLNKTINKTINREKHPNINVGNSNDGIMYYLKKIAEELEIKNKRDERLFKLDEKIKLLEIKKLNESLNKEN